jgi:hypothetical protein
LSGMTMANTIRIMLIMWIGSEANR